jgi:hypothetical protein
MEATDGPPEKSSLGTWVKSNGLGLIAIFGSMLSAVVAVAIMWALQDSATATLQRDVESQGITIEATKAQITEVKQDVAIGHERRTEDRKVLDEVLQDVKAMRDDLTETTTMLRVIIGERSAP